MSKKKQPIVDMIRIYSVKDYFNMIAKELNTIDKIQEADLITVKSKIIKLFQQELYGQIVFKLGPEAAEMKPDDLADMDGIQNILQQTFRKWRRLCILCSEHGLGNFFRLEDLQDALKDGPNATVTVPDLEEDVTDKLDEILPPGEEPVYLNGGVKIIENPDGESIEPLSKNEIREMVKKRDTAPDAEEARDESSEDAAAK